MVTSRAGATTRFGKVCAATTRTVMPDGLRAVSSDGFSGTGVVEPPPLKPWGLSANDTSPTFRPSTRNSVDGVSLPLGSRVSVATLVTAPIVSGPAVSPSRRLVAWATTVPPAGPICALDVARPACAESPAWSPVLADDLLAPGVLVASSSNGPEPSFCSGAAPASEWT